MQTSFYTYALINFVPLQQYNVSAYTKLIRNNSCASWLSARHGRLSM